MTFATYACPVHGNRKVPCLWSPPIPVIHCGKSLHARSSHCIELAKLVPS